MAEIINLNKARKAKRRSDDHVRAAANRALHGRTKAEKQRDAIAQDRLARTVDGAKRDDPA